MPLLFNKNTPIGILCINCFLYESTIENLLSFIDEKEITISDKLLEDVEKIKDIGYNLDNKKNQDGSNQQKKKEYLIDLILKFYQKNPSWENRLGNDLAKSKHFKRTRWKFDFLSKSELIAVFADWCADLRINVFSIPADIRTSVMGADVYLTKKTPTLKTEIAFIMTGENTIQNYNEELLMKFKQAEEFCDWRVFVTTPIALMELGLDKVINDMKKHGIWLYVIDPYLKRILGITKGNKSKNKDQEKLEDFMRKLPSQPIRAISQVIKISDYSFSESDSYHPNRFKMYYSIEKENLIEILKQREQNNNNIFKKYEKGFETLIVFSKESGLSYYVYRSSSAHVDELMISGFISAMDSFVKEMSGSAVLQEISYQQFKINSAIGKLMRIIVVSSESMPESFRERLTLFINEFETYFEEPIKIFTKTGNRNVLNEELAEALVHEILLI